MLEVGAFYSFCWSGRPVTQLRDAGVVFSIRNEIVGKLSCLTKGIKCLRLLLQCPHSPPSSAPIPHTAMAISDEVKKKFHGYLHTPGNYAKDEQIGLTW
ncbi:unnamed protein product [Schistocephalus solidus]|uniref:Uncharacterized protein n=1 Tax=Schistocephalus solidus TaxID=70667 RepID=A0A183SDJ0_SCHSO|nr:unnamed protein product [Schistocephalus solidus]